MARENATVDDAPIKNTVTYSSGSVPTHTLDLEAVDEGHEVGVDASRSDLGLPEEDTESEHGRIVGTVTRRRGFDAATDLWLETPSGAELHVYPRRGKVERVDDGERVESFGEVHDVSTLVNAGLTFEGEIPDDGDDDDEELVTDGGEELEGATVEHPQFGEGTVVTVAQYDGKRPDEAWTDFDGEEWGRWAYVDELALVADEELVTDGGEEVREELDEAADAEALEIPTEPTHELVPNTGHPVHTVTRTTNVALRYGNLELALHDARDLVDELEALVGDETVRVPAETLEELAGVASGTAHSRSLRGTEEGEELLEHVRAAEEALEGGSA